MAFPNQQLFLDRFIARNKVDYKDNPAFLERLNSLTLDDIIFTNFRKNVLPSGTVHHLTDMEMPGIFTAVDQDYLPGRYPDHGVASLATEEVLTKEAVSMLNIPGVYLVLSADGLTKEGAVLVGKGDVNKQNVLDIVKTKSLFALLDQNITINAGVTKVTIDSATVIGTLTVIESKDPANAIHDGTFKHDGTLKY